MDTKAFKDRVKRLREVNAVIAKLDPTIRDKAFELLMAYVEGTREPRTGPQLQTNDGADEVDSENFFSKHQGKRPAENALISVAYFYSQYGSHPFSLKQIKDIADNVGITVPERLDNTLLSSNRGRKALFRKIGKGQFRPTVHGETHMKTTYKVKKGTKKPQAESPTS